ncbi:hypothetical protein EV178_001941 [Coemansia sp. RSA 1646]|nr:hypothetical protein EV178_001941 [Coemansia sp. RSA 1646]
MSAAPAEKSIKFEFQIFKDSEMKVKLKKKRKLASSRYFVFNPSDESSTFSNLGEYKSKHGDLILLVPKSMKKKLNESAN